MNNRQGSGHWVGYSFYVLESHLVSLMLFSVCGLFVSSSEPFWLYISSSSIFINSCIYNMYMFNVLLKYSKANSYIILLRFLISP